VQSNYIKDD